MQGNISPNHLAIPSTMVLTDSGEVEEGTSTVGGAQAGLHGFVQPVVKWSKEGLLEHIMEFVVQEDQVRLYSSSPSSYFIGLFCS